MHDVDMKPGLSAWRARQRRVRRQWINPAILLTGVVGAGLYALPPTMNPLVHAGILVLPQAPQFAPIPQVNLAIPVRPSDLPKHRPTLSDARTIDQVEAAHVVGVVPSRAFDTSTSTAVLIDDTSSDLNHSGSGEPMLAFITATGDQLPTAAMQIPRKQAPAAKPVPAKSEPDEDLPTLRKRVFTPDR